MHELANMRGKLMIMCLSFYKIHARILSTIRPSKVGSKGVLSAIGENCIHASVIYTVPCLHHNVPLQPTL